MYSVGIFRAAKTIRKRKIVELLYDYRKNEGCRKDPLKFHAALVVLAVLCIFAGGGFLEKAIFIQTNRAYAWIIGLAVLLVVGILLLF